MDEITEWAGATNQRRFEILAAVAVRRREDANAGRPLPRPLRTGRG